LHGGYINDGLKLSLINLSAKILLLIYNPKMAQNVATRRGTKWMALYLGLAVLAMVAVYLIQVNVARRQTQIPAEQLSAAPKISVLSANQLYDLSGSEAYGGGDPFKLFDENADPKKDINSRPSTHPFPVRSAPIYFPVGKGLRIVIDLWALHDLKEIYWYDRSTERDTIRFYTGSMANWKESLVYKTAGITGRGWKSFSLNISSRYLMLSFNQPSAIITELVLYGMAKEKPATPAQIARANHSPKTLRQFAGTNSYDYVSPQLLKPFHQTRLYQQLSWYDADTVNPYPKNEITLNYFKLEEARQLRIWADSIKKNENGLWMSIFNMPRYLIKKGFNDKDKPVTEPGMDTENPLSYGRHAHLFWNLAAVYGNKKIDTALLNIKERPRYSGLALMSRFENGNEEDAYWTPYYWTPMDYFALSSADYDGHENRLGARHGIKNADPASMLITSGMVHLDTQRVKTLKFLCEQLRTDRQFIWQGGVQYHYYSNASGNKGQAPAKGISPEEDRLREKLARVKAFHDRLLPGVPVILGENGYDRMQNSWQATPLLPGQDAETSQAVMIIRSMMAAFMAGFDGYHQYMMRNATDNENATGAYASSGMIGGPSTNRVYQAWHYWNEFMNALGDYEPDSIISESGNVWVYKLRHQRQRNLVAYYLVSPTTNGHVIKNFRLNAKSYVNQFFKEIAIDHRSGFKIREINYSGELALDVSEFPTIILLSE
jgi:hypothetical protein